MTTEEKAKAYDEALKRAKQKHGKFSEFVTKTIEEIFPELRESENERMRKLIIARVRSAEEMTDGLRELLLTYLEKQKEQKPNIELIQRSWYMEGYHDGEFGKEPKWVIKTGEGGPKHELNPRYGEYIEKEQKPVEWSEKLIADVFEKVDLAKIVREQANDALTNAVQSAMIELSKRRNAEWSDDDEQYLLICKNALNKYQRSDQWDANIISNWLERRLKSSPCPQPKQEWSEKDKIIIEGACNALKIYGHTKLASMLESLRPQPRQELSKKDKKILQSLHHIMNCADAQNAVKRDGLSVADVCNFLFSIEPCWRPSEEQMEAFRKYIEDFQARAEAAVGGWNNFDVMIRLYEQLKKL